MLNNMNKLIADLLRNPLVSTLALGKIMNPERPRRVHQQIRTKNPSFTEEEVESLLQSDEFGWLSEQVKALNVEKSLTL